MKKTILLLLFIFPIVSIAQTPTVHRGGVILEYVPLASFGDHFLTVDRSSGSVRAYSLGQMQSIFSGNPNNFSGGLTKISTNVTLGGALGSNRSFYFNDNSLIYYSGSIPSSINNEIRYRMGTSTLPVLFEFENYLTSVLHKNSTGNKEMHFGLLDDGTAFQMRSKGTDIRLFAVGSNLELVSNIGIRFKPPTVTPEAGMVWMAIDVNGAGTWVKRAYTNFNFASVTASLAVGSSGSTLINTKGVIRVIVNGESLNPSSQYNITGTTLNFTPPIIGEGFVEYYTSE